MSEHTGPYDETAAQPTPPPGAQQAYEGYQQAPPVLPQQTYQQPPTAPQQVVFDLDKVQAEKRSQRERAVPFTTRIAGRIITFSNPKGLDWQELLYLGDDPAEFVELCIEDDEQREHVMSAGIDSDVMEELIGSFTRFYGIGDRQRGGRGNRRASRP